MAASTDDPMRRRAPVPLRLAGRSRALDGLRGLALVGMLAWHAEVGWVRGGFARMTIFFVLSGYLAAMSYHRMHERAEPHPFRVFWRRRTVRLLPVTVLGVAFGILVTVLVGSSAARADLRGDVFSVVAYVSNWRFAVDERSYGAMFDQPSAFQHYWSLSIEEQSFLLLPLVLGLATLVSRGHERRRLWLVGGLAVGCAAIPLVVHHTPDQAYYGTHVRFGEFLAGVVLAMVLVRVSSIGERTRRVLAALGLVSLGFLLWVMLAVERDHAWLYQGGMGLFAIPATLIIAACVVGAPTLERVLSVRPLAALGVWALSIYVMHWPLYLLLEHHLPTLDHARLVVVQLAAAVALGALVHRTFERPLMPAAIGGTAVAPSATPAAATSGLSSVRARLATARRSVDAQAKERMVLGASLGAVALVVAAAVLTPTTTPTYDFAAAAEHLESQREEHPVLAVSHEADDGEVTNVAVFGGSTALMVGLGFGGWADEAPGLRQVPGEAELGCGIVNDAERLVGEDRHPPDSICGAWDQIWTEAVAVGPVDVAVVFLGVWDTLDFVLEGDTERRSVGDPVFDAHLRVQLERVVVELTGAGADRVVFATTPVVREEARAERQLSVDHEQRVARFNALLAQQARRHEQVGLFDYGSVIEGLDAEQARELLPDGVHATWATSRPLWDDHLGAELLAVFGDVSGTGGSLSFRSR